jgi:hypothetical protein
VRVASVIISLRSRNLRSSNESRANFLADEGEASSFLGQRIEMTRKTVPHTFRVSPLRPGETYRRNIAIVLLSKVDQGAGSWTDVRNARIFWNSSLVIMPLQFGIPLLTRPCVTVNMNVWGISSP